MNNNNLLAGPYELFNEENPKLKVTLCINEKNQVTFRKYDGNKILKTSYNEFSSFEDAMEDMEKQIKGFESKKYFVKDHKAPKR